MIQRQVRRELQLSRQDFIEASVHERRLKAGITLVYILQLCIWFTKSDMEMRAAAGFAVIGFGTAWDTMKEPATDFLQPFFSV